MTTSRRTRNTIALALVLSASPSTLAAVLSAQDAAAIRGRVITADTGAPIRGATVTLYGAPREQWRATTDLDGRFAFTGLAAGRYRLSAGKPGFVSTNYGQVGTRPTSTAIELAESQTFDHVEIRLPRGGVISGRVHDESGEPAVEVYVHAMRLEYLQGLRRIRSVRTTQTNDLGQFRLYGLPPGMYYVSAAFRRIQLQSNEGDPATPTAMPSTGGIAPTFFPGTASGAEAQPVAVKEGQESPGVDFGLLAVRLARISGIVVGSDGRPAGGVVVWLNAARSDGALFSDMNASEVDANGRFTLPNVAPGDYTLDVFSTRELEAIARSGGAVGRPQGADAGEFASVPITVAGHDVDELVIATTPGYRLSGRLIVQGAEATEQQLGAVKVNVFAPTSSVSAVMLSAGAPVQADGSFEVRGLVGRRLIRVRGLPPGWALVSVTVSGADVTDEGLGLGADVLGAEIVVTATPPRLSGVVVDSRGAPVEDATVIVFSDDESRWTLPMTRYVTSARPDAQGRFSIASLPAGTYLTAVVAGPAPDDWAGPEFLAALRETGTIVRLAAATEEAVVLEVKR